MNIKSLAFTMLVLALFLFAEARAQGTGRNEEDCPPEVLNTLAGNLLAITTASVYNSKFFILYSDRGPGCFSRTAQGKLILEEMSNCKQDGGSKRTANRTSFRVYDSPQPVPRATPVMYGSGSYSGSRGSYYGGGYSYPTSRR